MTLTSLIIAALATWQIVEIVHHGEIFAARRAVWEARQSFFDRLRLCPFCLAVWIGFMTGGTMAVEAMEPREPLFWFWISAKLVVLGFAVSRLANLGNDVFHDKCRTPKADALPPTPETHSEPESDADSAGTPAV